MFHAPVTAPLKILDIGCGSGVVTAYLAQRFPSAQVVGVDIAPAMTDRDNMTFLHGDFFSLAASGHLQDGEFDFIFSRMLVAGMTDWPKLCRTVNRLLRPGGWAEMQDVSFRMYDENGIAADDQSPFFRAVQALCLQKGLDPLCGEKLHLYITENMSLASVIHHVYPWAWTAIKDRPETKLIAAHNQSEHHKNVEGYLLEKLNSGTGVYTEEQIKDLQSGHYTSKDKLELHSVYGVVYGQKRTHS